MARPAKKTSGSDTATGCGCLAVIAFALMGAAYSCGADSASSGSSASPPPLSLPSAEPSASPTHYQSTSNDPLCAGGEWPQNIPAVVGEDGDAIGDAGELHCFNVVTVRTSSGRDVQGSVSISPTDWKITKIRPAEGSLVQESEPVTVYVKKIPDPTIGSGSDSESGNGGTGHSRSSGNGSSPSHTGGGDTSVPAGATAICRDGTVSYSQHRRGTCSHHGGVAQWL